MKIAIIGAGNMGGAIARGLCKGNAVATADITVASPNRHGELDALKQQNAGLNVTTSNLEAADGADAIIVAVKPWLLDEVMQGLKPVLKPKSQILISIVAGSKLSTLASYMGSNDAAVFSLIPNTAIGVAQSMTFIAHQGATDEQVQQVCHIFDELGATMVVEERQMAACTALASCGIAYVMRYIRAAVEGGVELGLRADQGREIMLQTMQGAVSLLSQSPDHIEAEIDKVTTPGGLTIKGLNAMEQAGFTTAVIAGLKASMK